MMSLKISLLKLIYLFKELKKNDEFETRKAMNIAMTGSRTFQHYGDVLRPLDLCMRLEQQQQQQQQRENEEQATTVILQAPPPHNQQGSHSSTNLNLTEKINGNNSAGGGNGNSSVAVKSGVQNFMRNISLTPSPSSSSSFENEDDNMGCVGPPPFTIYRRPTSKQPAPVKVRI